MNRRQFIIGATGALAVATRVPGQEATMPVEVVDSHQHLWDRSKVTVPWLKGELDRDFLPADYAAATVGVPVKQAVYLEVDVAPESRQAEAEWVSALCASGKTPTVAAVVGGRPAEPGFAEYARQFRDHPHVRGVRQVLQGEVPPKFCLKPEFVAGVKRLGELGLTYDLCGPAGELANFAKLVEACPGTRFILDHAGNPHTTFIAAERDAWKRDLGRVAARPNVACKLSGFVINSGPPVPTVEQVKPYVETVIELFGVNRVMFGGDWPVVTRLTTLQNWYEMVKQILAPRSGEEQARVFAGTAREVYRLSAPGGTP